MSRVLAIDLIFLLFIVQRKRQKGKVENDLVFSKVCIFNLGFLRWPFCTIATSNACIKKYR